VGETVAPPFNVVCSCMAVETPSSSDPASSSLVLREIFPLPPPTRSNPSDADVSVLAHIDSPHDDGSLDTDEPRKIESVLPFCCIPACACLIKTQIMAAETGMVLDIISVWVFAWNTRCEV